MNIKYFQALGDIRNHLLNVVYHIDYENKAHGDVMIEPLGVTRDDKEKILEEIDVLRYMIGCKVGAVREEKVMKPSSEIAVRCFKRHLDHLERVYGEGEDFHTRFNGVKKQHSACVYYIQMFMDSKWYDKMPKEIKGMNL